MRAPPTPAQLQSTRLAIQSAIDPLGDGVELTGICQRVQPPARPEPCCRQASARLLQQLELIDQIQSQRFAACGVVGSAGDLKQAAPAILEAVARLGNRRKAATGLPLS